MAPIVRLIVGQHEIVLSSHALLVAVGVIAGAIVTVNRARERPATLAAVALAALAALAGAHWLFRMLHGGSGRVWSGGLTSTGGIVGVVVAGVVAAWLVRRSPLDILDQLAPAGILALAIGRVGCFLGGCCYGTPTTLPWGVVFPSLGLPARHPLQLYSAVADLAVFFSLPAASTPLGAVSRRAALGLGLARFALELWRDPSATDALTAWLTLPQALALALIAAAMLPSRLPPSATRP